MGDRRTISTLPGVSLKQRPITLHLYRAAARTVTRRGLRAPLDKSKLRRRHQPSASTSANFVAKGGHLLLSWLRHRYRHYKPRLVAEGSWQHGRPPPAAHV